MIRQILNKTTNNSVKYWKPPVTNAYNSKVFGVPEDIPQVRIVKSPELAVDKTGHQIQTNYQMWSIQEVEVGGYVIPISEYYEGMDVADVAHQIQKVIFSESISSKEKLYKSFF
jgi:hypothetical protein